jgi:hypothetical protein
MRKGRAPVLIHRPYGDELVAEDLNLYMNPYEVENIKIGDLLEVLCKDERHAHVMVKGKGEGKSFYYGYTGHQFDGDFTTIYIARRGTFKDKDKKITQRDLSNNTNNGSSSNITAEELSRTLEFILAYEKNAKIKRESEKRKRDQETINTMGVNENGAVKGKDGDNQESLSTQPSQKRPCNRYDY